MTEKWVAILDTNGILIGFDENPIEIKEGDVVVPENCDLTPGKYRWIGTTFWPLATNTMIMKEKLLRNLSECFYLLIKENPKIVIPEKMAKWINEYELILEREGR